MSRFVLSPRARDDLDGIWTYTTRRWGADQAERYVRRIAEAVELIAETPALRRNCDHVREGYRKYSIGSHVLFYRAIDDRVDVVRILHQRMDFDRHLDVGTVADALGYSVVTFRTRAEEQARGLVEQWKEEKVYPYKGQPESEVQRRKRQVFDITALSVATNLPKFQEAEHKAKQLQLRLLRHAIETGPEKPSAS